MGDTPTSRSSWFGFDRVRVDYKNHAVDITVGSESAWDRSHLRRLRQSSDLPGHVPVIDADLSSDGRPYVVTAAIDDDTLADHLSSDEGLDWKDGAGISEAVARACHDAHERGLFHGSLGPEDVYVLEDEIAVGGLGITRGGDIPASRDQWVAPEVQAGDTPTARSDVYSLGKLLEATLGDSVDLVPRSVKRLIMWSSSDTPEARPRSASEFAEILSDGLGENKNTFRPAFIPTIRANNLTADAERAVADTQLSTTEEPSESEQPDTAASDQPEKVNFDDDKTDKLDIVDLEDAKTAELDDSEELSPTDLDEGDIDIDPTVDPLDDPDPTEELDSSSEPKAPIAAAAAGVAAVTGAAALAKNSLSSNDEDVAEETDLDIDTEAEIDTDADAGNVEADGVDSKDMATLASEAKTVKVDPEEPSKPKTPLIRHNYDEEEEKGLSRFLVPLLLLISVPFLLWAVFRSGTNGDETANVASSSDTTEATTSSSSDDDEDNEEASSAGAPDTAEAPEETDAPETTEVTEETDAPETTEATEETDAPETTEATEETEETEPSADEPDDPEPPADEPAGPSKQAAASPIQASDAAVQVLHGIPGTPVDVYVDGALTAPGFEPESIAGPVELDPGEHQVEIFAAGDDPAESSDERDDDAVLDQTVTASSNPTTLIAHLDEDGSPTLSGYEESLGDLKAGESRLVIRNLTADSGLATVSIDGEDQSAPLANGDELQVVLEPGEHEITLTTAEGETIVASTIDVVEGELTTISHIGTVDDADVVLQRYSGLDSAPAGVPTGDSGLLGTGSNAGGARTIFTLMAVLLMSGAAIAFKRRRSLT